MSLRFLCVFCLSVGVLGQTFPRQVTVDLEVPVRSRNTYSGIHYVDDGEGLSRLEIYDIEKLNIAEWQVRLYKRGHSVGGTDFWGLISGKSPSDVMRKLKDAQEFEERYARWMGVNADYELFTNFNPLGPIAVLEKTRKFRLPTAQNELAHRGTQLLNDWAKTAASAMKVFRDSTAYSGNVISEYADELRLAVQRELGLLSANSNEPSVVGVASSMTRTRNCRCRCVL